MIVRYRIVEKYLEDSGRWIPWGTFYEDCSDGVKRTLLLRSIPDDDRERGRYWSQRAETLRPGVEDAQVILGTFANRFRVRPEIRTTEGTSHREIRARLWNIIFEEMERRRPRVRVETVEYAVLEPAYVALRERPEEPVETEPPE
jgi:hypothetical protein